MGRSGMDLFWDEIEARTPVKVGRTVNIPRGESCSKNETITSGLVTLVYSDRSVSDFASSLATKEEQMLNQVHEVLRERAICISAKFSER